MTTLSLAERVESAPEVDPTQPDVYDDGQPGVLTAHGERRFTGELDLFNDRQILVSGRTAITSRLIRVKGPNYARSSLYSQLLPRASTRSETYGPAQSNASLPVLEKARRSCSAPHSQPGRRLAAR